MGNWFSSIKNNIIEPSKPTNNTNISNKNYSKAPKKPTYIFSAAPNFRGLLLRKNKDPNGLMKELMVNKYEIFNKNLNKDNFAEVFIYNIMNDKEIDVITKIEKLKNFSSSIGFESKQIPNSNSSKGIKNAASIIKDNYDNKYKKQIQSAIDKLEKELKKSQNLNTTSQNSNTNSRKMNNNSQNLNKTLQNPNTNSRKMNKTSQNPNTTSQNPNKNSFS